MHIPVWERSWPSGQVPAGAENVVCVSAGAQAVCLHRGADIQALAGVQQCGEHARIDRGATTEDGTATQRNVPVALLPGARVVGCVRNVDGDSDLWPDVPGKGRCTHQPDLLLGCGDAHDIHLRPIFREDLDGTKRDISTGTVVHGSGRPEVGGQLDRLRIDDGGVTDADLGQGVVLVLRSDVDPEILQLRRLLAVLGFQQVGCLLPDHADHVTVRPGDADALTDDDLFVPATDPVEPYEPVFVDVRDDEPNLVDMALDNDRVVGISRALDVGV